MLWNKCSIMMTITVSSRAPEENIDVLKQRTRIFVPDCNKIKYFLRDWMTLKRVRVKKMRVFISAQKGRATGRAMLC